MLASLVCPGADYPDANLDVNLVNADCIIVI